MNKEDDKSFMGSKIKGYLLLFMGMVVAAIILLVCIRYFFPDAELVQISFSEGKSVSIKIEKREINYEQLLEKLFQI